MNLQNVRSIVAKDLNVFMKKRGIVLSVIVLPFFFSIGLPVLLIYLQNNNKAPSSVLTYIIPALSYFFVILASLAPTQIATYSLVGEKIEKSLEPLLATPLTDAEILLGKATVSFLPSIGAIYLSASLFALLIDFSLKYPGYYYLPDMSFIVIMLIIVPLTIIYSIEGSIIISSRVNDARTSSQLGVLLMLPFAVIYVLSEIPLITFDLITLLTIAVGLIFIDSILLIISRIVFRREEILTKWK